VSSIPFNFDRTLRGRVALDRPLAQAKRLRLLPSGDGWALVSLDGERVFSALGCNGRRRCLEFACAHGIVALVS
jgi:hypothetical protein